MEHTGCIQRRTFQESPLRLYYHDNHTGYTTETTTSWLQTNQNSTSDYDRQFSNQCDRCKMLKVVHGNQSDNHCNRSDTQPSIPLLIYIIQYYSSTRNTKVLPSPSSMHTHNTHSFVVLCFKTFAFVFENQSNKITTDSLNSCWFFAGIIYYICWS